MNLKIRTGLFTSFMAIFVLILTSCAPLGERGEIDSQILASIPAEVPIEQEITISTAHSDPNGLDRIEFLVDGEVQVIDQLSFPHQFYPVDFIWTPPGEKDYTLEVVAYSTNQDVDPTRITIEVTATKIISAIATQIKATETRPTETPTPTPTFTPTPTPTLTATPTCANPVIERFTANPSSISKGESSTLSWTVSGSTNIAIMPPMGNIGPDGIRTVSPHHTTTYTLVAQSGHCKVERTVTIVVNDFTGMLNAPTNLRVTSQNQTSFVFRWDDNSGNETGFRLQRLDNNQTFVFGDNQTENVITGLTCNTSYSWRIFAFNNQGSSGPSNTLTATTDAC